MQADTVIGIVGAVVLVSVMVGVFAYEYNNVPEAEPEPTEAEIMAQKKAAFNESFPGFNPDGDLDADGVPNWNETDLDNDGINNTEDDTLDYKREEQFSGSVSQGLSTPVGSPTGWQSQAYAADAGLIHVMLTLSHDARVDGQNVAPLDVVLSYPGGSRTLNPTTSGGTTTYTLELMDGIGAGDYQITVSAYEDSTAPVGGDPGTDFTGMLSLHYGL